MPLAWDPFVDLVRRHQRFVMTTHVRPDGDGLGSMLALADVLERQGKDVRLVIASSFPPRYNFLAPNGRIDLFNGSADRLGNAQVIVVLDTGTWNQLGDFGVASRERRAVGDRLNRLEDAARRELRRQRTLAHLGDERGVDARAAPERGPGEDADDHSRHQQR